MKLKSEIMKLKAKVMGTKSKKMLSMDFGTRSIKIVEGRFKKGRLDIENTYLLGLNEGVYEDGHIRDRDMLRETIDTFIRLSDIKTDEVVAVVHPTDILTRDVVLPNLSPEEIDGILRYKISDYIPIDPEEYLVQYINQGFFIEDGVEKLKLFIIVMPKSIAEEHFNLLKDIGLKAKVLDFQSNAIRKLLSFNENIKNNPLIKGKTVTVIDIGFFSSKLTIVKDSHIEISRMIPLGIRNLFENIGESVDLTHREILNVAFDLKEINTKALDFEEKLEINVALNSFLSRIFDSLEMIFRYYNSQKAGNDIDLIILQGDISKVEEVREKFENYLNIKTVGIDSLTGILDRDLHLYSNAIGGLIRGEDI